jgi:sugar transferase EpsL
MARSPQKANSLALPACDGSIDPNNGFAKWQNNANYFATPTRRLIIPPMYRRGGKRLLDLMLAIPGVIAVSPILLLTAIIVRLNLGKGVLFRQQRPGLHGKPFMLVKFRTMLESCDVQGRLLSDAERLTAVGRMLRALSLDELPQLWNVLRGDISLIGPRPLLMRYLPLYTPEQLRRHEVRPGITGWAQVNGRNAISWDEKFRLDIWYVDHLSFWLDLKILMRTIVYVLHRKDIRATGHATMPEFTGASSDSQVRSTRLEIESTTIANQNSSSN